MLHGGEAVGQKMLSKKKNMEVQPTCTGSKILQLNTTKVFHFNQTFFHTARNQLISVGSKRNLNASLSFPEPDVPDVCLALISARRSFRRIKSRGDGQYPNAYYCDCCRRY